MSAQIKSSDLDFVNIKTNLKNFFKNKSEAEIKMIKSSLITLQIHKGFSVLYLFLLGLLITKIF